MGKNNPSRKHVSPSNVMYFMGHNVEANSVSAIYV